MQSLGNNYARDEFKRHAKCKPEEANVFLKEWTMYAINLTEQISVKTKKKAPTKLGSSFKEEDLELFTSDQIVQLYELSQAATGQSTDAAAAEGTVNDSGKAKT